MKKIAIVYMAHDGFTSLYTGVGTVAQDFLYSFEEVARNLRKTYRNYSFDLYVATIMYKVGCFGYSKQIKQKTLDFISKKKNIHMVELINGSYGKESYGNIENWRNASISGATFIYSLSIRYDFVIAITVDTPFTQVGKFYFSQYESNNVFITWLPQSTVLIHRTKKTSLTAEEKERYKWEKESIDFIRTNKYVSIACVGNFMKNHLVKDYKASKDKLMSLRNSLNLKRLRLSRVKEEKIKNTLKKIGVPTNRPIIFSFGRAEYYKGLDLVLANSNELIKKHNFFVLILCSVYPDKYGKQTIKKLRKIESLQKENVKVYATNDFSMPHIIMQWRNTRILATLSRSEPFGLIPIESRFYRNKNMTVIVSNIGGLPEQINNGKDGFITTLDNKSIRKCFLNVTTLSFEDKKRVSINGYNKIISVYDQTKINVDFLGKVFERFNNL